MYHLFRKKNRDMGPRFFRICHNSCNYVQNKTKLILKKAGFIKNLSWFFKPILVQYKLLINAICGMEVDFLPNIKSAKKRVLVARKKTLQNQIIKSNLKTTLKKFDAAVAEGNIDAIHDAYRVTVKKLDQSVAKGILHKNTASRKKSQLANKVNAATANA